VIGSPKSEVSIPVTTESTSPRSMTCQQRHNIVQHLRHAAAADPHNQTLIIVIAHRKIIANDLEELLE
jgi:hypothetical protein